MEEESNSSDSSFSIALNLNKKRKRSKSNDSQKEELSNQQNKKKKTEIINYLQFPQKSINNNINNTFPFINDSFLKNNTYTTSTKNKYNYICQKLTTDINTTQNINNIQINDAKILILENKTLFFLLSNNKLFIYEIEQNKYFEFIKEIPLDQQNSFTFTSDPSNIFFITPVTKHRKKNVQQNNNNNSNKTIKTKMILYICILSYQERYLCEFDLKKLVIKKIKNILPKKKITHFLIDNDTKFKLYQNNRILSYNYKCAYIQKIYGPQKYKNLKKKRIESVSILNKNLFAICTSEAVYIYDSNFEMLLGDIQTTKSDKKAKLIKPDNNLLMIYSSSDVALYDLESLMFFQNLDLNNIINNNGGPIKKAKQLNSNNFAILFNSIFVVYNLEKNVITFLLNYLNINNCINSILMEINPNIVLLNNDERNFYLVNSIKGDKIASFNFNETHFNLCKKIKKYKFKYGVVKEESIEEDKNDKDDNYILMNNSQSPFILSSHKEI